MRIELSNLDDGKGEFSHVYPPAELNLFDERVTLCGPAAINGSIRKLGLEVVIKGRVESCAQVDCDRCLRPIQLPVDSEFSLEYIRDSEYESTQTAELTEELMSVSVFDGETIDVDEIAREQIILAVPTRSLCREDCKGFCEQCGADKNAGDCACADQVIDPRWAALKDLINGKS